MSEHRFVCADCGEEKVHVNPNGCGGTGYATVKEDGIEKTVCYDCCAQRDRADMAARGRIVLYLTEERGLQGGWIRYVVTNWPGTLRIPVAYSRAGSHNIAGSRRDVWFTDSDGCEWHGVCYGNNTQLCHCRRLKRKHGMYGLRQRCA
jgi:hypothetical protein